MADPKGGLRPVPRDEIVAMKMTETSRQDIPDRIIAGSIVGCPCFQPRSNSIVNHTNDLVSRGWLSKNDPSCNKGHPNQTHIVEGDYLMSLHPLKIVRSDDRMRDNHDGYPEIVSTYEREGQYFGAMRLDLKDGSPTVEFGVTEAGHRALKRILNARPFDTLPGLRYRYFFATSFVGATRPDQDVFTFHVRIEQGTEAKKFEFSGPKTLLSNLLWFSELKSVDQMAGLNIIASN